jgi:hypothetical protein
MVDHKKQTDAPNLALRAHVAARHVELQPANTQDLNLAGFDSSFLSEVRSPHRFSSHHDHVQVATSPYRSVRRVQLSHRRMRRQRTQQL